MSQNDNLKWLKTECLAYMKSKDNDHKLMKLSRRIRTEAEKRGFTSEQVDKTMTWARKFRDQENAKSEPHSVPQQPKQPEQTPLEKMQQAQEEQQRKRQEFQADSRRVSAVQLDQDNPTGVRVKGNYRGKSILDMAAEKTKPL